MSLNLKFLKICWGAMNVEIGLWPKFENWMKIHQKKPKTNGIWALELWNNLRKTQTLIWFWKIKTRSEKLRIEHLKFKPSSVALKFEPYINRFEEGLEEKNQKQEL
jgi:hypothetical protein